MRNDISVNNTLFKSKKEVINIQDLVCMHKNTILSRYEYEYTIPKSHICNNKINFFKIRFSMHFKVDISRLSVLLMCGFHVFRLSKVCYTKIRFTIYVLELCVIQHDLNRLFFGRQFKERSERLFRLILSHHSFSQFAAY